EADFRLDIGAFRLYNTLMSFSDFLRATFEILVLWFVIYQMFKVFRGTRAVPILGGLIGVSILLMVLMYVTQANVLRSIADFIVGPGIIIVVLFQPELRSALARLGSQRNFRWLLGKHDAEQTAFFQRVSDSVAALASKHHGALLVFCRNNKLKDVIKTGTKIDALFGKELVQTIFVPKTLLHDGALIIDGQRIVAAGCILPVSNRELADRSLGLRHRAALGMAENSDAMVVVVSEETGKISVVSNAKMMHRDVPADTLAHFLEDQFHQLPPEEGEESSSKEQFHEEL
ncbi:MAG: diadenylate cyclase CdaA, partial [Akkermansia sp.]